jgi:hypothetical protein
MANQRIAFFVEGVRTAARLAAARADAANAATPTEALTDFAAELEQVACAFEQMQGNRDVAVVDPSLAGRYLR